MQDNFLLFVRVMFTSMFVFTLFAGAYLFANFDKHFGVDPSIPSENGSSRSYSRVQIFSVWAHAVVLSGGFALLLH